MTVDKLCLKYQRQEIRICTKTILRTPYKHHCYIGSQQRRAKKGIELRYCCVPFFHIAYTLRICDVPNMQRMFNVLKLMHINYIAASGTRRSRYVYGSITYVNWCWLDLPLVSPSNLILKAYAHCYANV